MNKDLSERFFSSVNWFNDFFRDLKTLLDKITSKIDGYDQKIYYYYKYNDLPSIPAPYHVLLGSDDKLNLILTVVLNKELMSHPLLTIEEPFLFVVLHTYEKYGYSWPSVSILKNNIKTIQEQNGLISGVYSSKENPEIKLYAFMVPLNQFSEYSDQVVQEKVIDRINAIQELHDANAGENQ